MVQATNGWDSVFKTALLLIANVLALLGAFDADQAENCPNMRRLRRPAKRKTQ